MGRGEGVQTFIQYTSYNNSQALSSIHVFFFYMSITTGLKLFNNILSKLQFYLSPGPV